MRLDLTETEHHPAFDLLDDLDRCNDDKQDNKCNKCD